MIATIFAFIYITAVCWSFGIALLQSIERITRSRLLPEPGLIITCFCGLALIGTLFTIISLFLPLGTVTAQLLVLLPAVMIMLVQQSKLKNEFRKAIHAFVTLPLIFKFSLAAGTLLILLMHAWPVNHPDSLHYHAQNIKWIEEYRAVPGLANLLSVYGIQSSWFILSGLFSFRFTGTSALTFINAVVLIWFIAFCLHRASALFINGKNSRVAQAILWLLLPAISFWTYTHIRLTATSGSSDFITGIYIMLVVYLLYIYRDTKAASPLVLAIYLAMFALTLKLQSLPIFLLPLYFYFRHKGSSFLHKLITITITGVIVIIPYLARNIISTGYLIYPVTFPDIFNVDWKARSEFIDKMQDYIRAYARVHVDFANLSDAKDMSMSQWLPIWWNLRSVADKVLLLSIPLMCVVLLMRRGKIFVKANSHLLITLALLFPAILFWFISAPDPRFGSGQLLSVAGIVAFLLIDSWEEKIASAKKLVTPVLLLFISLTLAYTGYRFYYFFQPADLVQPAGIIKVPYHAVTCNGTTMIIPDDLELCAGSPLPCTRLDCSNIELRGNSIEEGFKLKSKK